MQIKYHFSRIRQLVDEREKRITDKLTFNTTEIYKCNKETESNMKRLQDCLLEKIEQTTKFSKISDYQLLQADIDLGGLTWYHSPITQSRFFFNIKINSNFKKIQNSPRLTQRLWMLNYQLSNLW